MTNTCSAVAYHSVYVWEGGGGGKSYETDVNVSQNDHSASFYISLCVWSKVMILNFISCGLILEVQDNIRCLKTVAFHIFSCLTEDILHTFKSVYVVQLYPV